jgi:antirestriction protein ArdC
MAKTVYEIVTEKIIEKLESGNIPWVKPWHAVPCNYESERPYSGVNTLLLFAEYDSPYWLTWNQIQKLGGHVRKGEHSFEEADLLSVLADVRRGTA